MPVYHTPGLVRQWRVNRDDIGFPEQLFQGLAPFEPDRLISAVRNKGIVEHHIHAEGLGPKTGGRPDPASTDNAKGRTPRPPHDRRVDGSPFCHRLVD